MLLAVTETMALKPPTIAMTMSSSIKEKPETVLVWRSMPAMTLESYVKRVVAKETALIPWA